MSHIVAPFTPQQVKSMNDYQKSGVFHEFTCGNESSHQMLVVTEEGWHCLDCDYRQNWAHDWMGNDEWRRAAKAMGAETE